MSEHSTSGQSVIDALLAGQVSGDELRRLMDLHEREEAAERAAARQQQEAEKQRRIELMRQRHDLRPSVVRQAIARWKEAASHGAKEFQLLRFPCEVCTDDGRAITNAEKGWQRTLVGFPAQVYELWERDLKPHGLHLRAEILDFPDGKPGDVGLILSWL